MTDILRNERSSDERFAEILRRHRRLHDLDKPLVKADFDHALDVWQWVLRLRPEASLALQVAALFHDIERLVSEADVRLEQHAADYQQFKDAHARAGAVMMREALADLLPAADIARAAQLVAEHERPGADEELATLNDADALSFFSLNSSGFYDYYGPDHTRRKVAYTLGRLRGHLHGELARMTIRPEVRAFL